MQTQFQPQIPQNLLEQEEHQLYDFPAERGFLACIKKYPALVHEAERLVRPDHLFLPANRAVYTLMLYMSGLAVSNGFPLQFDRAAMFSCSQSMGTEYARLFWETTEGMEQARWIELMEDMVSADSFHLHANRAIEAARRVSMFRLARQMMLNVANGSVPATQVAMAAGTELTALGTAGTAGGCSSIADADADFMERSTLGDAMPRVTLPSFPGLMNLMRVPGLDPGSLHVIAARAKTGKSYLMLALAIDAVRRGIPVLFMDSELHRRAIYERVVAAVSGVPESAVSSGAWMGNVTQRTAVDGARQWLRSGFTYADLGDKGADYAASLILQFGQNLGTVDIPDADGRVHRVARPGLVIYDWLRMADVGSLRNAAEWQSLGFQTKMLKEAAARAGLAVIAAAQLNRDALNATPADWAECAEKYLSGSDRIAHYASSISILRNLTPSELVVPAKRSITYSTPFAPA